jgi:protein required for attachment to host cells
MKMMTNPRWLVLADTERGRLLQAGRTEMGSVHVEPIDRIEHRTDRYEHSRPSPRAGQTGDTQDDHEDEEEEKRFARRLSRWIGDHVQRHGIERLVLFASPRMLGTLRKLTNGRGLPAHIDSRDTDLTSLTVEQLTEHRAIQKLVAAT